MTPLIFEEFHYAMISEGLIDHRWKRERERERRVSTLRRRKKEATKHCLCFALHRSLVIVVTAKYHQRIVQ